MCVLFLVLCPLKSLLGFLVDFYYQPIAIILRQTQESKMTFECIRGSAFTLKYTTKACKGNVLVYRVTNDSNGEYIYDQKVYVPSGKETTISIYEHVYSRHFVALGTATRAGELRNNETGYWISLDEFNSWGKNTNIEIDSYGNYLIAASPDTVENKYRKPIKQYLNFIEKEAYLELIRTNSTRRPIIGDRVVTKEGSGFGERSYSTDVKVTNLIASRPFSWYFDFIQDGVDSVWGLLYKSLEPGREDIPPVRFEGEEGTVEIEQEREFVKLADTQAVEILSPANAPHLKTLYLVDLNEQGTETGRTSIFTFGNNPGESGPSYEVLCNVTEDECPDGTYQLDCGDYLCCYKPDGYAHSRIDK